MAAVAIGTMALDRRAVLKAGTALGAMAAAPQVARALAAGASKVDALFDAFLQEQLQLSPEMATYLGMDKGPNAALRGKLSLDTPAHRAAAKALTVSQLARLDALDDGTLSPADKLNVAVIGYTLKSRRDVQQFDFGGSAFSPSPYVISQLTGAYQDTPSFLDTKHPIDSRADAEAYLARLAQFADQLDADTARLGHDVAAGVVPPDFLVATTLDQMAKTRVPADQAIVVESIRRRAKAKGLDAAYGDRAAAIYDKAVLPAIDRQIAAMQAVGARASADAGVWHIPQGEDFYRVALRSTTTLTMTPEEVHKFGLDQAEALTARLDGELRKAGYSKGTVGARMAALYKDPSQLYPDTPAGKEQAIAYCNGRLAAIRKRLPQVFDRLPPYTFEVRAVPAAFEAGAPSAYSEGPAPDGSRPGLVFFNLADTAEWPKFCLATTVYHEGLPGHQLQGGLALAQTGLPMLRKIAGFSGYAEGWALYAEQLADEIGMYDDDPLGRLGYLKFQLFRANRCVVDTGIHHYRWTREQAIARFVEGDGEAPGFAKREVERYCATPGQACAYKLGQSVFLDLRDKARASLGDRYRIKDFHDTVIGCGRVPLEILKQIGDRWIAGTHI